VELENRLQEAGTLHRAAIELCQRRASRLQKALDVAEHLHSIVSDISSQLTHIRDDSVTIRSVSTTDRATIQQHLSELQARSCSALCSIRTMSCVGTGSHRIGLILPVQITCFFFFFLLVHQEP